MENLPQYYISGEADFPKNAVSDNLIHESGDVYEYDQIHDSFIQFYHDSISMVRACTPIPV